MDGGILYFQVDDNSMADHGILKGDVVVIDRAKSSLGHNDIVLVYTEHKTLLAHFMLSSNNKYILINPEYGKYEDGFIIGVLKSVVVLH